MHVTFPSHSEEKYTFDENMYIQKHLSVLRSHMLPFHVAFTFGEFKCTQLLPSHSTLRKAKTRPDTIWKVNSSKKIHNFVTKAR
jgi:hypothetical protein